MVTIKNIPYGALPYGTSIRVMIESITQEEDESKVIQREKQLAQLLTTLGRHMSPFDFKHFNSAGLIRLTEEAVFDPTENAEQQAKLVRAIHVLNFLNFLRLIGEPVRRFYRNAEGEIDCPVRTAPAYRSDRLAVASIQARTGILLCRKRISLNQVFGDDGPSKRPQYGPVAAPKTIDRMDEVERMTKEINRFVAEVYCDAYVPDKYRASHPDKHYRVAKTQEYLLLRREYSGDSEDTSSIIASDSEGFSASDEDCASKASVSIMI